MHVEFHQNRVTDAFAETPVVGIAFLIDGRQFRGIDGCQQVRFDKRLHFLFRSPREDFLFQRVLQRFQIGQRNRPEVIVHQVGQEAASAAQFGNQPVFIRFIDVHLTDTVDI